MRPGVGIDLLVEEIHALEQCLHLFRGIEQGQGERADDVPVLVAERDAVDEVFLSLPCMLRHAPSSGSPEAMTAGMPGIGDEIRNVAAHGIFRADAQVIGVGVVDEPDDAVPVADEQPRWAGCSWPVRGGCAVRCPFRILGMAWMECG